MHNVLAQTCPFMIKAKASPLFTMAETPTTLLYCFGHEDIKMVVLDTSTEREIKAVLM